MHQFSASCLFLLQFLIKSKNESLISKIHFPTEVENSFKKDHVTMLVICGIVRPDKKIYLSSVPARPENCPRPQFIFYFLFL